MAAVTPGPRDEVHPQLFAPPLRTPLDFTSTASIGHDIESRRWGAAAPTGAPAGLWVVGQHRAAPQRRPTMTKTRKTKPATGAGSSTDTDVVNIDVKPTEGASADSEHSADTTSASPAESTHAAKPPRKQQQLAALVIRDEGATLDQMIAATGWLPHTTRAALTGLKKKGYVISSDKVDGVRTYRGIAPE